MCPPASSDGVSGLEWLTLLRHVAGDACTIVYDNRWFSPRLTDLLEKRLQRLWLRKVAFECQCGLVVNFIVRFPGRKCHFISVRPECLYSRRPNVRTTSQDKYNFVGHSFSGCFWLSSSRGDPDALEWPWQVFISHRQLSTLRTTQATFFLDGDQPCTSDSIPIYLELNVVSPTDKDTR
jgi:hypothetical protein